MRHFQTLLAFISTASTSAKNSTGCLWSTWPASAYQLNIIVVVIWPVVLAGPTTAWAARVVGPREMSARQKKRPLEEQNGRFFEHFADPKDLPPPVHAHRSLAPTLRPHNTIILAPKRRRAFSLVYLSFFSSSSIRRLECQRR